jgi:superfamily II DNA or RNA helicase
MKLYSYQENAIDAIFSDPSHSQLISMPTGTGKTITFLSAAKRKDKNCLIIVHREELLHQTYEKSKLCGFKEDEISIISSTKKETLSKINISMIQTLCRNLEKYKPEDIEMVIIDEAHHATSASYLKVLEYFKIFSEKKILLGFTATPLRGDKAQLSSIFESHSFKMTLSEATQQGYICPVYGIRVVIDRELKNIKNTGGDYKIDQLDRVMNCDSINKIVAERCQYLEKVPAIVFCTSVDHAEKISNLLKEKNRKAACVSYKTPKDELGKILCQLKNGEIEFITNAVKLSEGFDFPPIQTIISARPTRSPVLYKQMIGRGLRLSENKYECFVLEFCGNDPKMMSWEDIDNNATFQSFTEAQRRSVKEATEFYKSRFRSPQVNVLDVRISPFQFYECRIRRIEKYKNFYYLPHDWGFSLFELIRTKGPGIGGERESGFNIFGAEVHWKDQYGSFYIWGGSAHLWPQQYGWYANKIVPLIKSYGEKQLNGNFGKWYPSEEQPITMKQKKILKSSLTMSARKAEMYIEDRAIKKAIQNYWIDQPMKDLGCGGETIVVENPVTVYCLPELY